MFTQRLTIATRVGREEVRRLTAGQGSGCRGSNWPAVSPLSKSIQACNYGARIGIVGVLDGLESFDQCLFLNHASGHCARHLYGIGRLEMRRFSGAVEAGSLNPVIDRVFPMENLKDAYSHLHAQKHFGKIVIQVSRLECISLARVAPLQSSRL